MPRIFLMDFACFAEDCDIMNNNPSYCLCCEQCVPMPDVRKDPDKFCALYGLYKNRDRYKPAR